MNKKDLALFLGMSCGDGYLSIRTKKRGPHIYYDYYIGFCNTDKRIIKLFADLFYKIFEIKGNFYPRDRLNRKRIYEFHSYSRKVFNTISSLGFPIGIKRDVLKIPFIVLNGSKDDKLNFFLGVLITDGCIRKNKTIIFHLGSKLFLEEISNLIYNLFNIKKEIKKYIQKEKFFSYQLSLNKKESQQILSVPPSHNGIAPVLSFAKFSIHK